MSETIFGNRKSFDEKYFLFHLKSYFCSQVLKFCLDFSVIYKSGLIKKIRLISKFMTSQPEKQTVALHILPNISTSNGNQTVKFGKLIEYNMRNISFEKSYRKYGEETIPRPFSKKWKLSMSLNQYSKVLYNLFLLYVKLRAIQAADHLLLPHVKLFIKWKQGWN